MVSMLFSVLSDGSEMSIESCYLQECKENRQLSILSAKALDSPTFPWARRATKELSMLSMRAAKPLDTLGEKRLEHQLSARRP